MDAYRGSIDNKHDEEDGTSLELIVPLPTDRDISNTLRAHRDRHGTRQKPIGIVKGLQHLLQDLKVPATAFGEYTFTALLTCCRTPQEGRRIFKLMRDHNHEISSYSWSILVDVRYIYMYINKLVLFIFFKRTSCFFGSYYTYAILTNVISNISFHIS